MFAFEMASSKRHFFVDFTVGEYQFFIHVSTKKQVANVLVKNVFLKIRI